MGKQTLTKIKGAREHIAGGHKLDHACGQGRLLLVNDVSPVIQRFGNGAFQYRCK